MAKKQIVFIEGFTTAFTFKLAKELKKRGYENILITIIGGLGEKNYKEAFDKIISVNAKFIKVNIKNILSVIKYSLIKFKDISIALREINKLNPYLIIYRATPNWLGVLSKFLFRKYPFVYFPYDIRNFCYKDKKQAKKLGVPNFELLAERYCFENADGIIHKGDEDELKFLHKKKEEFIKQIRLLSR